MIFTLSHPTARQRAKDAIDRSPDGYVVRISEPTRTLEQNAKLWPVLNDISQQVDWHGRKLSAEDWKHVFSAALKKQEVVPNLDGTGFVVLGLSTSKMSKRLFSDLLELALCFGTERGVKWSDGGRDVPEARRISQRQNP